MTLDTNISKVKFLGNGITTDFPFNFKIWNQNQLKVFVELDKTLSDVTAECTITLLENGGNIHYLYQNAPLPKDSILVVLRNMPFLQSDAYISGTRFDANIIETAFDLATAERQQLKEQIERAILVPVTNTENPELMFTKIFEAQDQALWSAKEAKHSELAAKAVLVQVELEGKEQLSKITFEGENQVSKINLDGNKYVNLAKNEADRAENAAKNIQGFTENAQTFFGFYLDENCHLRAKKAENNESLKIKAYETWGILPSQVRFFINDQGHLLMQIPFV